MIVNIKTHLPATAIIEEAVLTTKDATARQMQGEDSGEANTPVTILFKFFQKLVQTSMCYARKRH